MLVSLELPVMDSSIETLGNYHMENMIIPYGNVVSYGILNCYFSWLNGDGHEGGSGLLSV